MSMRLKQEEFLAELKSISPEIAKWVEQKFNAGMTVKQVREELRALAKIARPPEAEIHPETQRFMTALDIVSPSWAIDFADAHDLRNFVTPWRNDGNNVRDLDDRMHTLRISVASRGMTFIRAALHAEIVVMAEDATIKGAIKRALNSGVDSDSIGRLVEEALAENEG